MDKNKNARGQQNQGQQNQGQQGQGSKDRNWKDTSQSNTNRESGIPNRGMDRGEEQDLPSRDSSDEDWGDQSER